MDLVAALVEALRAAVGVPAAAYALAGIGLNVHYGYTGLLNFGHVAFMMVGAYGTAVTVDKGWPLWAGFLVGAGLAVVLGIILGLPTLRLRAAYLAMVTIAAAEILRLVNRSRLLESVTEGVRGITGFAGSFYALNPIPSGVYGIGDFRFSSRNLWAIVVGWALVALCVGVVALAVRSPWGRVLRAIREDEDAARALGKNVFAYKLQSLVVGGVIGSFAGMLLAVDTQAVSPDTYVPVLTFFVYVVVISGGPARVLGPILGSVAFWFIIQLTDGLLREAIGAGHLGFLTVTDVGAIRFALVGLGLMLLVIFRPQGILGRREDLFLHER